MLSNFRSITYIIFPILMLCNFISAKEEELKPELKELLEIAESEKTLMKRMDDDVAQEKLDIEVDMRVKEIKDAYASYVEKYPQSVFGKILQGKFLRKSNEPEIANDIFLEIHDDNPDIAVVNQQLALYASETGKIEDALNFFKKALELDTKAALIHYQYGEFLYTYKIPMLKNNILPIQEIEKKLLYAFQQAHQLAPDNRDFKMRLAESYFDIYNPNWYNALPIWDELLESSKNTFERDVIKLQKARVLIKLNRKDEAKELIKPITDPALIKSKHDVLKLIKKESKN